MRKHRLLQRHGNKGGGGGLPFPENLLAHYPMDETGGTDVLDVSGNDRHATTAAPIIDVGGLKFRNINSVGTNHVDPLGQITTPDGVWSFMIRVSHYDLNSGPQNQVFMYTGNYPTNAAIMAITMTNRRLAYMPTSNNGNWSNPYLLDNIPVGLEKRHFLASDGVTARIGTHDLATDQYDWVEVPEGLPGFYLRPILNNLVIGSWGGTSSGVHGAIRDVAFWNTSLTAADFESIPITA